MGTSQLQPHPADAVAADLRRRDPSLSEALLDALSDLEAPDDADPEVWGPTPDAAEVVAASARSQARLMAARSAVLSASLRRAEAAQRLGVTPQHVSRLVAAGELIALESGRELRLPEWQFHAGARKGRIEGIAEIARAFPGSTVLLTQWVLRPNPAFQGRTPLDALVAGEVKATVAAATVAV